MATVSLKPNGQQKYMLASKYTICVWQYIQLSEEYKKKSCSAEEHDSEDFGSKKCSLFLKL